MTQALSLPLRVWAWSKRASISWAIWAVAGLVGADQSQAIAAEEGRDSVDDEEESEEGEDRGFPHGGPPRHAASAGVQRDPGRKVPEGIPRCELLRSALPGRQTGPVRGNGLAAEIRLPAARKMPGRERPQHATGTRLTDWVKWIGQTRGSKADVSPVGGPGRYGFQRLPQRSEDLLKGAFPGSVRE